MHFADCYWVRVTEALPDDPIVHTSIVAYLSDMGVGLGDEIRALDASASSAPSIDHSVWFHRRVRADDWLLFDMRPLSASAGRGLYTGSFYDRNGRLAATMIQEVILRYQPGQSPAI